MASRSRVATCPNAASHLWPRRLCVLPWIIALSGAFVLLLVGCEQQSKTLPGSLTEHFSTPVKARHGKRFGTANWLTFELYRGGTILIDGRSGVAWQQSDSYLDVALIRSTHPLPRTYKVSAVVGKIDYELEAIEGLDADPQYAEGPKDENGCYLLAITDTKPSGHHTNDWWHRHRKVVIDVDNNVWGSGMPHPMFMVYFDTKNNLVSWDGRTWQHQWKRAVEYQPDAWYMVAVERTPTSFIFSVSDEAGTLLQRAEIAAKEVWRADDAHPEYLVLGDPHENYYQGSMQITSISLLTP